MWEQHGQTSPISTYLQLRKATLATRYPSMRGSKEEQEKTKIGPCEIVFAIVRPQASRADGCHTQNSKKITGTVW